MTTFHDERLQALVTLGEELHARAYRFVTVTPATHARVNGRPEHAMAHDLPGIFGWSRAFTGAMLDERLLALLESAGLLQDADGAYRSAVRWSSLEGLLFAHSAYPTRETDAVFFGPDTYRFTRALGQHLQQPAQPRVRRAVDIGCGAGPGAILIARAFPAAEVHAVDINPRALDFTRANALLAGVGQLQIRQSNLLDQLAGQFDLIVANPPYLLDPQQRTYRHGGGPLGAGLSLEILRLALTRLAPGGTLLLYSGAAVVNGEAALQAQAHELLAGHACDWCYAEIDPDVFGEELDTPPYRQAERIAAVLLTVTRRA